MNSIEELRYEAYEALERNWFRQTVEERDHTDISLSLRLHIRPGLFIQVSFGQRTESLFSLWWKRVSECSEWIVNTTNGIYTPLEMPQSTSR